ncbi:MAG: hypothetical protein ACRELS_10440 [Candidatus Rokuibacteriota bacterium]
MPSWIQLVLLAAVVAVAAALVLALLSLRRAARRADGVLAIVEQELRPLIGQAHGLIDDARGLTRETTREVEQVRRVTERLEDVAGAVARVVVALSGLTRAGQLVGVATGVRRGIDVFVQRFRKERGDHHE